MTDTFRDLFNFFFKIILDKLSLLSVANPQNAAILLSEIKREKSLRGQMSSDRGGGEKTWRRRRLRQTEYRNMLMLC